jgi:hypothetical protein
VNVPQLPPVSDDHRGQPQLQLQLTPRHTLVRQKGPAMTEHDSSDSESQDIESLRPIVPSLDDDRILALELVRATEAAAIASADPVSRTAPQT